MPKQGPSSSAVAIHKKVIGDKDADYAMGLNNLALLYQETGDFAKAEPIFRQVLAVEKQLVGEKHPA